MPSATAVPDRRLGPAGRFHLILPSDDRVSVVGGAEGEQLIATFPFAFSSWKVGMSSVSHGYRTVLGRRHNSGITPSLPILEPQEVDVGSVVERM